MVRIKASPQKASFPAGQLGFAIGDIHGRADLLAKMFDRLEAAAEESRHLSPVVIFLGDYVDRGLDSARVLDMLLSDRPRGFTCHYLRGNHEQAMQQFLTTPTDGRGWLAFGGAETLLSYGVKPVSAEAPDKDLIAAAEALQKRLPEAHLKFFASLQPSVTLGDYYFVHAGVDPNRTAAEQQEQDLYWIRGRFLTAKRRWEKFVVHGHTPAPEPYQDDRRIGIDTGAYATGKLTAVRLEADRVAFMAA